MWHSGNRRWRRPAAGFLALLASCGADSPAADGAPPDLLLVTFDTLRSDRLGCYGHGRATSPRLDALAEKSALFEVAYAPVGTTCPSHASLFTGLHPLGHGVVRNGFPLEEEQETLAETLRSAGYRTAAFVSSYPVSRRFGFAQGFGTFDDRFPRESASSHKEHWGGTEVEGAFDRVGGATVDAALRFLASSASDSAPLFLWVHLFDPHSPYTPPPDYRALFPDPSLTPAVRLYEQEIAYADAQLGRLLDAWEERGAPGITLVTADHGEGLGDHGLMGHNRTTYEEEVRVPLVVSWPGVIAPTRSAQPAHLVDVVPTLRALLGLGARPGLEGRDLSRVLLGDDAVDAERVLYLQRPYYVEGRFEGAERETGWGLGLRRGRWKFFEAPDEARRQLFDLERDPEERVDLAHTEPRVAAELSAALAAWHAEQLARHGTPELSVPADTREGLEALGYLEPGDS